MKSKIRRSQSRLYKVGRYGKTMTFLTYALVETSIYRVSENKRESIIRSVGFAIRPNRVRKEEMWHWKKF